MEIVTALQFKIRYCILVQFSKLQSYAQAITGTNNVLLFDVFNKGPARKELHPEIFILAELVA